jgi:hypothetical protein
MTSLLMSFAAAPANPQHGQSLPTGVLIVLVLAIIAAGVVLFLRNRRR